MQKKILVALMTMFSSTNVFAATAVCSGKIQQVGVHKGGHVFVEVSGMSGFILCNISSAQIGTTPGECKGMYAAAMTAKVMGQTVVVYVDNAPTSECSSVPAWHVSDTRYFAVMP